MAFTDRMRQAVRSEDVQYEQLLTHTEDIRQIAVTELRADPGQPRRNIDGPKLRELQKSIEAVGILNPIIVRENPAGWRKDKSGYVIIAGERRWHAATSAGLLTVPCIVKDVSEQDARLLQLIENLQRDDLTQQEEAESYIKLVDDFSLPVREIARRSGRDVSQISRLVNVYRDDALKAAVVDGDLPLNVAASLLPLPSDDRPAWVKRIKRARAGGTFQTPTEIAREVSATLNPQPTVLVDVNGSQAPVWPTGDVTPPVPVSEAVQGSQANGGHYGGRPPVQIPIIDYGHHPVAPRQQPTELPEIVLASIAGKLEQIAPQFQGGMKSAAFIAGVKRDLERCRVAMLAIESELH